MYSGAGITLVGAPDRSFSRSQRPQTGAWTGSRVGYPSAMRRLSRWVRRRRDLRRAVTRSWSTMRSEMCSALAMAGLPSQESMPTGHASKP
jgi:hypothetical protein